MARGGGEVAVDWLAEYFDVEVADASRMDRRRSRSQSPEEALAIGVLRQALEDLRRAMERGVWPCPKWPLLNESDFDHYRDAVDAYAWLTDTDGDYILSFESICHLFGIDPAYLRAGIVARLGRIRGLRRSDRTPLP